MDQASLWSLAEVLSREGNLERSNRYIEYSWGCTQRYNTHLRSWLVSPVLGIISDRSEEHTSELQSRQYLVCRLLLEKKKNLTGYQPPSQRSTYRLSLVLH